MHGHGSSVDFHHHGHSHRTGAATRYWREPKPIAATVVVFVILLFIAGWRGRQTELDEDVAAAEALKSAILSLPTETKMVVWHDGTLASKLDPIEGVFMRDFEGQIKTSCQHINGALLRLSQVERKNVKITHCSTLECLWMFHQLLQYDPNVVHVVSAAMKQVVDENGSMGSLSRQLRVDDGDIGQLVETTAKRARFVHDVNESRKEMGCEQFPFATVAPITLSECTKPGDRTCDNKCPLKTRESFYRSDLRMCVTGSPCSLLTSTACLDRNLNSLCHVDCQKLFFKEMRIEGTRDTTITICLVTLNLLGFVLGLLFAKLYWVDPLLDDNERLKGISTTYSHSHSHSENEDHHRH